jgi:anthranilate synthase component 2
MGLLLIDNYDSFTFNLFQMVQAVSAVPVTVVRNDNITLSQIQAMGPQGIIFSPGPGHPAVARDFGACQTVLDHLDSITCPILGVCLGHQGMGLHFGGQVIQAPEILHGKTSQIYIEVDTPLFTGLSNPFQAMRYHSLVVADEGFPDCLEITARERQSGLIMGLRHRTKPLHGVQFHPESIGTPEGQQLLINFVALAGCSNTQAHVASTQAA